MYLKASIKIKRNPRDFEGINYEPADSVFKQVTDTMTPRGLWEQLEGRNILSTICLKKMCIYTALEDIRDPGNLGNNTYC